VATTPRAPCRPPISLHRYWERQNPFSSLRALHLPPMLYHRRALFRCCSAARRRASCTVSWPSSCASDLPSTDVLVLVPAAMVPRASRPPGCRRSSRGHLYADSHDRPRRCPTVDAASTPLAPHHSSAKPSGS
jgi:hypothetical protein